MKKILLLIIAFMIMQGYLFSQESRFGEALPPRGTIRVLLVFAELIADTGSGCPGGVYDPTWLSGPAAPPFADEYLDFQAGDFSKKLTQYYKDVSLGELEVLGDYYNGTVQVPCSTAASQGGYERAAINQLNAIWQPVNGQYLTKNNVNLNDFDHYGTGHYTPKEYSANGDGLIDVVVFLWRNRPFFDCGQGHGVGNSLGSPVPLGNKAAQLYGSWGFCPSVYATNGGSGFFSS
jgi:hypothetical protein